MNSLIHLISLFVCLTFVVCELKEEVECNKKRGQALEGKTDDQLYNLTQENLEIGKQMVSKRVDVANAAGFTCYKQFYDKYINGLSAILQTGEKERLDKAKTPKERSEAIKMLAGITQGMRCDEDWRAANLNETLNSAKCSSTEKAKVVDLTQFKPKFATLKGGLFLGKTVLKIKNNVVSGIVGEIQSLFTKVYSEGEKCSLSLSTATNKCNNIKIFVNEISRLFYLIELTVRSKF